MGRLLRLTVDYIALRVNLKGSNIRLEKLFGICCMKARTAIIKGHNWEPTILMRRCKACAIGFKAAIEDLGGTRIVVDRQQTLVRSEADLHMFEQRASPDVPETHSRVVTRWHDYSSLARVSVHHVHG
jgi:hypothetical protein